MAKTSIFDTEAGFEEIRRRRDDIAREEARSSNPGAAMSIPVPQPVQPATDLSESDYWLGFEMMDERRREGLSWPRPGFRPASGGCKLRLLHFS
jgi:hypothetical protein